MSKLNIITEPKASEAFDAYPAIIRDQMWALRDLVRETAEESDAISELLETRRWGEPAFVTKIGSTLRMDWKPTSPQSYALYFQCTTRLVETFRMVFDQVFHFEGNRAIRFGRNDVIPVAELKQCIRTTLTYHKVKKLDNLGL